MTTSDHENLISSYTELLGSISSEVDDPQNYQSVSERIDGFLHRNPRLTTPVRKRLQQEVLGCGPLEDLLHLTDITEILINSYDEIWLEQDGKLRRHGEKFVSAHSYEQFIQRLSQEAGLQANLDRPFANGVWRQFRVHLLRPPLAMGSPHLSLRYRPLTPWNFNRLKEFGWASETEIDHLRKIVYNKQSLIVVGPTGSGKTSVLNACLQETASNERTICIEDTDEVILPNKVSAKLLTRVDPNGHLKNYTQSDLIVQSLRMRPDRLVVGEVRGGEAKDLLMALATGHRGGMGTLHAESARQALLRLEMLIQLGAPKWKIEAIRSLIVLSLNYIVVVGNKNGQRILEGIYRLASAESTGILLEKVSP